MAPSEPHRRAFHGLLLRRQVGVRHARGRQHGAAASLAAARRYEVPALAELHVHPEQLAHGLRDTHAEKRPAYWLRYEPKENLKTSS